MHFSHYNRLERLSSRISFYSAAHRRGVESVQLLRSAAEPTATRRSSPEPWAREALGWRPSSAVSAVTRRTAASICDVSAPLARRGGRRRRRASRAARACRCAGERGGGGTGCLADRTGRGATPTGGGGGEWPVPPRKGRCRLSHVTWFG